MTKLLVQPDDGVVPLLDAISSARRSLDLYVFRLDDKRVAEALGKAARRGVAVRALVAHTNRGGEASLRKLEARLHKMGIKVSRSDDDLPRYHGKMAVIDGARVFVLGYNFTRRDMEKSRSFGLVLEDPRVVRARATDAIRQAVSTRLHDLARRRVIETKTKDWSEAFYHRGPGSTVDRARDIRSIYDAAAPIPAEMADEQATEFMFDVRVAVAEAIKERKGIVKGWER
jgi:phosphatidylserine/phosphatidylglycerophosphate/cardiolipin synthase-like enzyme